jgi:hypothetical protein
VSAVVVFVIVIRQIGKITGPHIHSAITNSSYLLLLTDFVPLTCCIFRFWKMIRTESNEALTAFVVYDTMSGLATVTGRWVVSCGAQGILILKLLDRNALLMFESPRVHLRG